VRKRNIVTIPSGDPDKNRDQGKSYLLTEMPARQAEKFAMRLVLALAAQKLIDPEIARNGVAGLSHVTTDMLGGLSPDVIEPLLDEMLDTCVDYVGDPSKRDDGRSTVEGRMVPISRPLIPDDIEEVTTLLLLRGRLIDLHTGFSVTAFLSRMGEAAKEKLTMLNTPTSLEPQDPSSDAA
jgi:hypothetical protein